MIPSSSSSSPSQFQFFCLLSQVSQSQAVVSSSIHKILSMEQAQMALGTFALEVKTRAEDSESPLEKVSGSHLVQTNFQMACTGDDITFLQSYLPEKEISHFFYVKRNDLLIDVVKDITDQMLENKTFIEWHYDEYSSLKNLGQQLMGTTATFEWLRPLRSWINVLARDVQKVSFC